MSLAGGLRTERHLQQAQRACGDRISINTVAVFNQSARVWDGRVCSLLSDSQLHRELLCERPTLQQARIDRVCCAEIQLS